MQLVTGLQHNINGLRHEEFEELSQSLVQQIIGPGSKVYGVGSDGAREATFYGKASYPSKEEQWDGYWIFQAKFHDINRIGQKNAQNKIVAELDQEIAKIEQLGYKCDNYIFITNVSLSPVYKTGVKDRIDNKIIPKYQKIKHIHVWGFEEVSRFLDAYPEIRKTYNTLLLPSDVIAQLMENLQKEDANLVQTVKLYCQGCFDNEYSAVLDDAGDTDDKLPLDKIFIDLDVKPSELPSDQRLLELIPEWLKEACVSGRSSALSYLLDDRIKGLVLVGGPGCGKSTLCQGIAQIHRGSILGKINEFRTCLPGCSQGKVRLPFRILLREYAQWVSSQLNSDQPDNLFFYISQLITKFSGTEISSALVQRIVQKIPVLLILDGLDEVSDKKLRTKILDNFNSFSNQVRDILSGDLRVMATTRLHGYSEEFDPKHYLHLILQQVSFEKAFSYARLWANSRVTLEDIQRTLDTFKICITDKVVGILSQTPLQITILLVIIRARGTPPKQREELFDRYMDIIYQRETKRRPELLQTERELIYGLHKYIAYVLHKRAEKDATAALMDLTEFKEKVTEYLVNTNPLLDGEELEEKANQIMREAGLRLVLIEGVQEGRIGFGLTSIREFFAAAHLVDTAKNTLESDLRFKAIATLPHWRNVALFFAGRVGRNRPGEAPSMIDICRSIDIEGIDRFLKRGAKLVSDIVDDRDLREPHNEISAVQYCMTLVEDGYVEKPEELALRFKSLPVNYKEKILLPWLEDKLKNTSSANVKTLVFYYQKIFGNRQPLIDTLLATTNCGLKEKKVWVFSKVLEFGIAEPWTIKLLEELNTDISDADLRVAIQSNWFNLEPFLAYDITDRTKATIGAAIVQGTLRVRPVFIDETMDLDLKFKKFEKLSHKNQSNHSLVSLLFFLNKLMKHCLDIDRQSPNHSSIFAISSPPLLDSEIRLLIDSNKHILQSFLKEFSSNKNEPFLNLMNRLCFFLLNPSDSNCHKELSHAFNSYNTPQAIFPKHVIRAIIGQLPENTSAPFYEMFGVGLNTNLAEDTRALNELLSNSILSSSPDQVLAVCAWLTNRTPQFEKGVDNSIVDIINIWLKERHLPQDIFALIRFDLNYRYRQNVFSQFNALHVEDALVKQLIQHVNAYKKIPISFLNIVLEVTNYNEEFLTNLRIFLNSVLSNSYLEIADPEFNQLEVIYWSLLQFPNIIKEDDMFKFYNAFHTKQHMPRRLWFSGSNQTINNISNFFLSDKIPVKRLAGISFQVFQDQKIEISAEIANKLWELSQNKQDFWNNRYLKIMASCKLDWANNYDRLIDSIKNAQKNNLETEWGDILERSGYSADKDREALVSLLIEILEKRDEYSKIIRNSALFRLAKLATETQSSFEDAPLDLPLPKRKRIRLNENWFQKKEYI